MKWSCHGTQTLKLEQAVFGRVVLERSLITYERDSRSGKNGVAKGSGPLLQVEPTDYAIPTVHACMGIFQRYFENHVNGEVNSMDRTDDTSAKTLKEHKKNHTEMLKEEKCRQEQFDRLVESREDALCAKIAYENVPKDPIKHLKSPEDLCDSALCIINHIPRRQTTDWIKCDTCEKYYHFACSCIFSPKSKINVKAVKQWKCNECSMWDMMKHHAESQKVYDELETETRAMSLDLNELTRKRVELESLLYRSNGKHRQQLEAYLSTIGCDVRTWYQTLGGNQVRKILRKENIEEIFKILRDTDGNKLVKKAMLGLAQLMSYSNNRYYSDQEIDEIEMVLLKILSDMKTAFPNEAVTPKLHLMAFHLIPYMRKH
uniref:PHD-type domain-containing protein n=1 Tax=Caenorhabditis japonica TaxID=281687 RepID=A0A8R1IX47_CAEJA